MKFTRPFIALGMLLVLILAPSPAASAGGAPPDCKKGEIGYSLPDQSAGAPQVTHIKVEGGTMYIDQAMGVIETPNSGYITNLCLVPQKADEDDETAAAIRDLTNRLYLPALISMGSLLAIAILKFFGD